MWKIPVNCLTENLCTVLFMQATFSRVHTNFFLKKKKRREKRGDEKKRTSRQGVNM